MARLLEWCGRVVPAACAVALVACSSSTPATAPDPGANAGTAPPAEVAPDESDLPAAVGPAFADLPEGFTAIAPGGNTICGHGGPYSFFVRKGKTDRVVLDFSGGGACWNVATCAFASYLFSDDVRSPVAPDGSGKGIYDTRAAENPFKDWTHVFVPYCTGDIHWGDNVQAYGTGPGSTVIQHKGAENVRAVLAWLFANVAQPEKIFVTGCSAGSYGSILWAPRLQRHYPKARVLQFGDSGAGVITDTFFSEMQDSWRPQGAYPQWIVGNDVSSLAQLYTAIAKTYPNDLFSQYNAAADATQVKFFTTMGGPDAATWSAKMASENAEIAASVPNYRYFTGAGEAHCAIPFDRFYTQAVGGERLVDWVQSLVDEKPAASLACDNCSPAPATR
jgi:hypothetical protein